MPVRPAGIGRPKADADFEAEVYSLEIPMRPCYVRRERSQRIGALERGFSSPTRSLIIVVFRHTRRKGNDYAQAQTQPTATVREDPTATAGSPRGDPGRDP